MEATSSPNGDKAAEPVGSQLLDAPAVGVTAEGSTVDKNPASVDTPPASQPPSPSPPAPDTTWIEKAAQQRFDRMYAVTSAGTRTGLTWLAFLVIIWLQSIQPKLMKLNQLSYERQKLEAKIGNIARPEASVSGGLRKKYIQLDDVNKSIQTEVGEAIELPFGIKLKSIPPIGVPLFWSGLMLGLLYYLLSVRREALVLAGRAVRLLYYQAALPRERLSDVSLGAAWWLAPLPTLEGSLVKPVDLWHALGWSKIRKKALYTAIGVFLLLTMLEGVVLYASLMLAQTVRRQQRDKLNRHEIRIVAKPDTSQSKIPDRKRAFFDEGTLLLLATLLSGGCYLVVLFKWFRPSRVYDNFAEEDATREDTRRRVLAGLAQAAIMVVAVGYGFALVRRRRAHWQTTADYLANKDNPRVPRFRRTKHKHRRTTQDDLPAPGIYQNPKSLVFHVVAAGCKHKSGGTFHLKEMKSKSVEELEAGLSFKAATTVRPFSLPQPSGGVPGLNRPQRLDLHKSDVPQLESLALLRLTRPNDPALAHLSRSKPVDAAIQMVRQAIERTPKSIRLYDLLAAIAVRYKRNEILDWVVTRAQELKQVIGQPHDKTARKKQRHRKQRNAARDYVPTPKGSAPAGILSVERRINKWKDNNSRWYKKWSNTTTSVSWAREVLKARHGAGLPM